MVHPTIALFVFVMFIVLLFYIDRSNTNEHSIVIWVPIIWFLFIGGRSLDLWLYTLSGYNIELYDSYLYGNTSVQILNVVLIILSIIIIYHRNFSLFEFINNNILICLFYIFCGISVIWSEYSLISIKRYIKAIENILILLVILSEPKPYEAFIFVIRRCAFILIPLSICLIRYFPTIGRSYNTWTGDVIYIGVTDNKNVLGRLCMVFGLVFYWDILKSWKHRDDIQPKKYILVSVIVLIMTASLLYISKSTTSLFCFIVGIIIISISNKNIFKENPKYIGRFIFIVGGSIAIFAYYSGILEMIVRGSGKDMTFTERTYLWSELLKIGTNPWIGTGYESFWRGNRLAYFHQIFSFLPNEAHNGYLEIYLNIGTIGLVFLFLVIISGYARAVNMIIDKYHYGVLAFVFIITLILYNITEAAFKSEQILWNVFLFMAIDYKYRNIRYNECV